MALVLQSSSYTVREAGSSAEARKVLKDFTPELLILDVIMESMGSGFDLAKELKQDPAFSKIKIIMLTNVDKETGFDFKADAGDSTWLPVDDYLLKPFDPKILLARVKELIG